MLSPCAAIDGGNKTSIHSVAASATILAAVVTVMAFLGSGIDPLLDRWDSLSSSNTDIAHVDICGRTPQAHKAIVEATGAKDCTAVDSDAMADIKNSLTWATNG